MKLDNLGEKMNSLKIVDHGDGEQANASVQTENYVVNYLKSMLAIEEAIEPYKEQKKELRKPHQTLLAAPFWYLMTIRPKLTPMGFTVY